MRSQYKKGVLELCVLSSLYQCDRYGYDIAKHLSQHIEVTNGTVYQVLRRLMDSGLITTNLSEESGGHLRKYYSITGTGSMAYQQQKQEWLVFVETIDKLLSAADHNEQGNSSE